MVADLFLIVLSEFRDHCRVHSVESASELCILEYHCFQRSIACTLSDAEQRAVHTARPVQPGCSRIVDSLIKIIVSVEFDQFARHTCVRHQSINNARNGSRYHCPGEIHSKSHCITDTDLHRNLIFFHQLHQFNTERDHKAIDVRTGDVFKMTSRTHSCLHALADHRQIMVQSLLSRHFQFIKNVIIRAAHKNSRLFKPDILYKLKILFARADPAGHLRELIAFLQAFVHSIPVLFAVKEELALTDLPIRTSQSVQIIVDRHDLLRCIRCPGLLAVTERSVCNPDLIRHIVRHDPVIKRDLRYLVIVEQIAEHIRCVHINQREHMLLQFQKIRMFV